jgi:hypothetical protein
MSKSKICIKCFYKLLSAKASTYQRTEIGYAVLAKAREKRSVPRDAHIVVNPEKIGAGIGV